MDLKLLKGCLSSDPTITSNIPNFSHFRHWFLSFGTKIRVISWSRSTTVEALNQPAAVARWRHVVRAGSGRGPVRLLLLRGSVGLVWVVLLEVRHKRRGETRWRQMGGGGWPELWHEGAKPNLERGPVHVHPRAVVVAEPLQVLLRVCSQDRALQLSVYRGIAVERRKWDRLVTIGNTRGDPRGAAANLVPQCSNPGRTVSQNGVDERNSSVSCPLQFGLNDPDDHSQFLPQCAND